MLIKIVENIEVKNWNGYGPVPARLWYTPVDGNPPDEHFYISLLVANMAGRVGFTEDDGV